MKTCIYCDTPKAKSLFSEEHIFPASLGGKAKSNSPNPFITYDVCRDCNNKAGRHIDGPFINSHMIYNLKAQSAFKFLHSAFPVVANPLYMGTIVELAYQGKICECFIGPTGDTIYHFHLPYPKTKNHVPTVGRPTYLKKEEIDLGFAFLFIKSEKRIWLDPVIKTFLKKLKGAKLYLGNSKIPKNYKERIKEVPQELNSLHTKLIEYGKKTHTMECELSVAFESRFLVKMALAVGCNLLHPSFRKSLDILSLREFMWTPNFEKRTQMPMKGTGHFAGGLEQTLEIFRFHDCHVFYITEAGDDLCLVIFLYGEYKSQIVISSDKTHWDGLFNRENGGNVYVLAPEIERLVGPIRLMDYLAYKQISKKNEELLAIEKIYSELNPLPSF